MGIRWRLLALGPAVAGAVLLGGCGQAPAKDNGVASISTPNAPSSTPAAAAAGQTDEDKARAFAKCMRAHGVDMPDPQVEDGKVRVQVNGGKADKGKIDAANQACKDLMPGGGPKGPVSAQDLDRARTLAKCMREHGVNVPDPTAGDPGIKIQGGPDQKSEVDAAMRACDPDFGKEGTSTDGHGDSSGGGDAGYGVPGGDK